MRRINMSQNDFYWLISASMRYSMGRKTSAAALFQTILKEHGDRLRKEQLETLEYELNHELTKHEDIGEYLGEAIDHTTWKETLDFLRYLIKQSERPSL